MVEPKYKVLQEVSVVFRTSFRGHELSVNEKLMIFAIAVRVEPGSSYDTVYKFDYQVGRLGKEKDFVWVNEVDIVDSNGEKL